MGGRCYDGVCLPIACGNGRLDAADPGDPADHGEVCDDGNQTSGDGCSSDCQSVEMCGNGVVDPVKRELCDDGDLISNDGCDSVCQPEVARWLALSTVPSERSGGALAYDIARDRMVMFGGLITETSALTDETWEATPAGWIQREPFNVPSARAEIAMAYDVIHRQTVLFGGAQFADTWTWDGTNWTPRAVYSSPSRRTGHAMAYDERRGRVVLFGGRTAGLVALPSDETWEWDGAVWAHIATRTAPPGRVGHALAYDPQRGVVVMFGGGLDPNVYEYDGNDWRSIAPSGPAPEPRTGASLAFDATGGRVLLFGGKSFASEAELVDTWAWDGSVWTPLATPDPPPDAGHMMATDLRQGLVVMYGTTGATAGRPGEASRWTWVGTGWRWDALDNAYPGDNGSVSATRDPLRGRILEYSSNGIAEFDGATWKAPNRGPTSTARFKAVITYDVADRYTLLFGGLAAGVSVADTWSWDGTRWTEHVPAVSPPARDSELLASDDAHGGMIMFGGEQCDGTACEQLDDTWRWEGDVWTLLVPVHRPPARTRPAFAYDPSRGTIVMFGGQAADGSILGDTWVWDGVDWLEQHPATSPMPRDDSALAWDAKRRRLVLFGGGDADGFHNDAWEWDGASWNTLAVEEAPTRAGHTLVSGITGGVVLFSGLDGVGHPNSDTSLLKWEGPSQAEACRSAIDGDGDGRAGCEDPDCWWACTPLCPPGLATSSCDPSAPRCGDGVCNHALEDCWLCPADCECRVICGDAICEPSEDAASCPGDCP